MKPIATKREVLGNLALLVIVALPAYGLLPQAAVYVGALTGVDWLATATNVFGGALFLLFSPVAFATFRLGIRAPGASSVSMKVPDFIICGQKFSIVDLYTNVLITGKIGSGKTSVAIWSLMADLFKVFSREHAVAKKDPFLKLGGLSLDVKGEFFEAVLWFGHEAKRNVLDDVVIIRPKVRIPVAKFVDERGYFFFLSALQVSTGTEFGKFVARFQRKDNQGPFPMDIANKHQSEREGLEAELREMELDVMGGDPLCFIGWRREGQNLVRVSHTPEYGKIEYRKDTQGNSIVISPPRSLRYVELIGVDNGLRFNLVNPRLSAAEVSKRLVNIGKLVDGGKSGGDNAYWDKSAARTMAMCIEGWRIVKPNVEISGPDILRMTSQKEAMKEIVEGLREKIENLDRGAAEQKNPVKAKEMLDLKRKCEDIRKYFIDSWDKLEPKTKSIVESVIQNMFGEFITDGNLQESFCSPTTFTFEDCIQKGTFFCFVAGREYEALSKVMATALKTQFQSVMLERPSSAHLDQSRTCALIIDECQANAVAGGSTGSGDEHFMSLARQSKVINVNATQSDASLIAVIGKENADVYLQQYGGRVWFQNGDPTTNKRASELCGQIYKERLDHRLSDYDAEVMFGLKDSDKKVKHDKEYKKEDRYPSDSFAALDVWESVTLNMGRKGTKEKVLKQKNIPHSYSGDDNRQNVGTLLRWYIQAYPEQLAARRGESAMFDHCDMSVLETVEHHAPSPVVTVPTPAPTPKPTLAPQPVVAPAIKQPVTPPAGGASSALDAMTGGALPPAATPAAAPAAQPAPAAQSHKSSPAPVRPLLDRAGITVRGVNQIPDPQKTLADQPFSEETNAALSAGKISMADLEEIRAFYRDPKTNVMRAAEVIESITREPLVNPQVAARELTISREKEDATAADRTATHRGQVVGNPAIAAAAKPIIEVRAGLQHGESLDLADEVGKAQKSRFKEVGAKVEAVATMEPAATPSSTAVATELATPALRSKLNLRG